MVLVVGPRLAGPLAVAVADLRKWYHAPDPEVRRNLAHLQEELRKVAIGGHSKTSFDPGELARQSRAMSPLLCTFEDAASLLACSKKTIARRASAGDLAVVGSGPAARVVVASLHAYVARAATPSQKGAAAA